MFNNSSGISELKFIKSSTIGKINVASAINTLTSSRSLKINALFPKYKQKAGALALYSE